MKKIAWLILAMVLLPIVVVMMMVGALYYPPVQNWAVHKACEIASEKTGMEVYIDRVRLAFPLDVSLEGVRCVGTDSMTMRRDTLLRIDRTVCDIRMRPLLDKDIQLKAVEMMGVRVNTSNLIPQVYIRGSVGRLAIENPDGKVPPSAGSVGEVDLEQNSVAAATALLDKADLYVALVDTVDNDTTKSEPWTVFLRHIDISDSRLRLVPSIIPAQLRQQGTLAQTTTRNVPAQTTTKDGHATAATGEEQPSTEYVFSGLNAGIDSLTYSPAGLSVGIRHAKLKEETLGIDVSKLAGSLGMKGDKLDVDIRECALTERHGLDVTSLRAKVEMDSVRLKVDGTARTPASVLTAKADMDLNAFADSMPGKVSANIDASLCRKDLLTMLQMADVQGITTDYVPQTVNIKGSASGNTRSVVIPSLSIDIPGMGGADLSGSAKGFMALADNPYSPQFSASVHGDAQVTNTRFLKSLLDKGTAQMINIPAFSTTFNADIQGADYALTANIKEGKGRASLKGRYNMLSKAYDARLKTQDFNADHVLKGYRLGIVNADAHINNKRINATVDARGKLLNGNMSINALNNSKRLQGTLTADIQHIDFQQLGFVDQPLKAVFCGHVDIDTDMNQYYKVSGLCSDIHITDSARTYSPDDVVLDVLTRRDTTYGKVFCGDMECSLRAQGGYKWLLGCTDRISAAVKKQMKEHTIDQQALREALPRMTFHLKMGKENPVYRMLNYKDIDYREICADFKTSREDGINGNISIGGLNTRGYQIDTLTLNVSSTNDPMNISYKAHIQNQPPNDYVFDAYLDGNLLEHGISMNALINDGNNETGLKMGAEATMTEEGLTLHLVPDNPVIGYQTFRLNRDNYVRLNRNNRVTAYVNLRSDDNTGIQILSTEPDDIGYDETLLQDLTVSLYHLDIGRLAKSIPYAPEMDGLLYSDFHFIQQEDKTFTISTDMNVTEMTYEGCHIGNLGTELVYIPKEDGSHYVDGDIKLEGRSIGTVKGQYNFDSKKVDAVMALTQFPMDIVNGFIPNQLVGLQGTAEGNLDIHGTTEKPVVNGTLTMDKAYLLSLPYGIRLKIIDDKISINNSKLEIDNMRLVGSNDSPLTLNGSIDVADTEHPYASLRLIAKNLQLIDAKETKTSEAYGKAFINIICGIRGELSKLSMRGKLDILPTTDLYYILRESPLTADNRLKELVTFTDLTAEEPISIVHTTRDDLNADFTISVNEGAHIKCWISPDHKNYLDFTGEGDLRLRYRSGDINLTGRFTISEGEMKYSLPIIPLKTFTIAPDSYIEFTGDMMNPRLNITATEQMRASVNQDGTNQICTFETGVVLSKTLKDMGLQFIISAPENQMVSDELKTMSQEERGKIAVTMLTTGMYLSDGNTSNFSMNSALNNFLQAEIQNLTGAALKTIDLSFGLDRATEADGTMHTDYTFKFAKRFWNNRLNIAIGGKISTGPDVSGQNKSFFDNVEVQYRLSETANKYVTMFYKRSVYDYLEGYVGQFGAGYMWKRKAQTLRELFGKQQPPMIMLPSAARRDTLAAPQK